MSIVKINIINIHIILIILSQKLAEAVLPVIKDQSCSLHRSENSPGINLSLAVHLSGVRVVLTGQVRHPPSPTSNDERHQLAGLLRVQLEDDGGSPSPSPAALVAGPEVLDLVDPVVAVLLSAGLGEVPRHPGVLVIVVPGVALVRQHRLEWRVSSLGLQLSAEINYLSFLIYLVNQMNCFQWFISCILGILVSINVK